MTIFYAHYKKKGALVLNFSVREYKPTFLRPAISVRIPITIYQNGKHDREIVPTDMHFRETRTKRQTRRKMK